MYRVTYSRTDRFNKASLLNVLLSLFFVNEEGIAFYYLILLVLGSRISFVLHDLLGNCYHFYIFNEWKLHYICLENIHKLTVNFARTTTLYNSQIECFFFKELPEIKSMRENIFAFIESWKWLRFGFVFRKKQNAVKEK